MSKARSVTFRVAAEVSLKSDLVCDGVRFAALSAGAPVSEARFEGEPLPDGSRCVVVDVLDV